MAVFGLPHAHDDDALRAVRAAIGIRDATMRLGEELGLSEPLRVRIGINSGPVVAGAGPADQFLVSGPVVNLAARLQALAEPGEILVGETTRQLTDASVRFSTKRSVRAKGFADAVTVWPVEALSARSSRRTIPLVGRRREMDLLSGAFGRAADTSRLHLVAVRGEPGIGKSRLLDEFLASLDNTVHLMRGRASRFDEDAVFAPVAEMIRREIGAPPEASPDETAALLRSYVAKMCRPEDVESTATRLGLALGLGSDRSPDRPYRVAEVRAGLLSLVAGLAGQGPVVLAFEDLELAPGDLLELIEQLALRGRRLPVLVVCVGRDEMLDARPGWPGALPDAMSLRLEPLTDSEAVELARTSADSLDDETAARIARHAGGNPFFIVETTGMLMHERGRIGGSDAIAPLPPTVQAVVATRIDHLDPEARELVRKASVFARSVFHVSELAIVASPSKETLAHLEEEEVLVRDRDRPDVWRFGHQVVRDVAYESLPKRERLRLHLAIADALETENKYPGVVAYHLERAARASLDLMPGDRALAERAALALLQAGDVARRRMELRSAIDIYERAIALGSIDQTWAPHEAYALCGIGEARYWLGQFEDARLSLDRALRAAPEDDRTRSVAHRFLGDIALNTDADVDRADHHLTEALEAARRLPLPDGPYAIARTLLVAAWVPNARGDHDGARRMFEEALATARGNPERDRWAEARALSFIASVVAPNDDDMEAMPLLENALALGREMNDPFTTAVAEQGYGTALSTHARFEEAFPHTRAAVETFRELGARWETAAALGDLGELYRLARRPREGESHLREAIRICNEIGDRQQIGWISAELARNLRMQGRADEGRALLDEIGASIDLDSDAPALRARALLEHGAGNDVAARAATDRMLALPYIAGRANPLARATWFTGRVLGPEAAGGEEAVRKARERLIAAGWTVYLDEPDLPGANEM
jgi:tetratricopeptide (TPR) repeat protein